MCILRYTPEHAAVGVDDDGGVPVDAGRLPLEQRHDQHDGQLAREARHRVRRRAGNRLGEIEAIALLRLAEVRRVEQLLEADDLRTAAGRLAHQPLGARDVGRGVGRRVILDEADGERQSLRKRARVSPVNYASTSLSQFFVPPRARPGA